MEVGFSSVSAYIKVSRQPSKLEIKSDHGITLDLEVRPGEMEMHTEQVRVEIDQSQCFNESGLMNLSAFMEDSVSYARTQAARGLSRIVDQGNRNGNLKGGDPMKQQFHSNAFELFNKDWNMVTMPTSRPDFTITGGTVDIKIGDISVDNRTRKAGTDINFTPARIDLSVGYRNSNFPVIDISV